MRRKLNVLRAPGILNITSLYVSLVGFVCVCVRVKIILGHKCHLNHMN